MAKKDRCVVCGKLFVPWWRKGWEPAIQEEDHMCIDCRCEIMGILASDWCEEYEEEERGNDE